MFTFLDLLIVVFMVLTAVGLLGICLMFLVRNQRVRKISFYLVAAMGLYASTIGVRIAVTGYFMGQLWIGILLGILSIAAFVLERMSKGDEKKFKIARILAAVALLLGIVNAFMM